MVSLSRLAEHGGTLSPTERETELRRCAAEDPEAARILRSVLEAWSGDDATRSRYVDRDVLAQGGMGAVHRTRDLRLGRTVAKKVVLPRSPEESPDPDRVARFLREARITARLDHPGIAPLYDVGIDASGQPFFTMAQIEGDTLGTALEAGRAGDRRWTLQRLVDALISVCETVAYAHEEGVVHRDLKPANVMVGPHGEVLVIDWGLAGWLDDAARAPADLPQIFATHAEPDEVAGRRLARPAPGTTLDGDVLGTPFYMAPEQGRGQHADLGPAADVYSIGAILYECLGGTPPYGDSTSGLEALQRLLQEPPAPLSTNSAPAALVAICERAMARAPQDRYPNASALAADLTAFRQMRPVTAQAGGPFTGLWLWARRNRALALAAVALLILGVAGAVMLDEARRQATNQARLAEAGVETAGVAIDSLLTGVGDDVFEELPGGSEEQARLYEDALEMLSRQLDFTPDRPEAQLRYAAVLGRTGGSLLRRGENQAALHRYEQRLEILEALRANATADQADVRVNWLITYDSIARAHLNQADFEAAGRVLEAATRELERPPWTPPEVAKVAGNLFHTRAKVQLQTVGIPDALPDMDRAIEAYTSLGDQLDAYDLHLLVDALTYRGMLRAHTGAPEGSRADFATARSRIDALGEEALGQDYMLRMAHLRLQIRESDALDTLDGPGEPARAAAGRGVELAIGIVQDFPDRRDAQWQLAETLRFAGALEDANDELEAAADLFDRSLDVLHPFLVELPDSPAAQQTYAWVADALHSIAYQMSDPEKAAAVPLRRAGLPAETGLRLEAATQLARLVTVAGASYFSTETFERMRATALRVAREEADRAAAGLRDPEALAEELGKDVWDGLRSDPGFPK